MSAVVASSGATSATAETESLEQKNKVTQQISVNDVKRSMHDTASIRVNGQHEAHKPQPAHGSSSRSETSASTDATADAKLAAARTTDNPLPLEVRKIVSEVARTGTCSWLPWTVDGAASSSLGSSGTAHKSTTPIPGALVSAGPLAATSFPASTANKDATTTTTSTTYSGNKRPLRGAFEIVNRKPVQLLAHANTVTTAFPGAPVVSTAATAQQSSYRRSVYSAPFPHRKRPRNGLHNSLRSSDGHKRPLVLFRTHQQPPQQQLLQQGSTTTTTLYSSGPRTSGSEHEDMSYYDSEGTSATSNSEVSTERRLKQQQQRYARTSQPKTFNCQRDAFQAALSLVLDYFQKKRGGYKLSRAEQQRCDTWNENEEDVRVYGTENAVKNCTVNDKQNGAAVLDAGQDKKGNNAIVTAEEIFQQRKQHLLNMLGPSTDVLLDSNGVGQSSLDGGGPPFTIQRIAEVLIAPERYYTQTHKLCNCLEKLLLVTSSFNSFGGITGGDSSQTRLEERERAALAEEQGRLQSDFRHRRFKRWMSSASESSAHSPRKAEAWMDAVQNSSLDHKVSGNDTNDAFEQDGAAGVDSDREILEAAARASLRSKFDHVGMDLQSSGAVSSRDVLSIAQNRGMTNSPPPPMVATVQSASLTGLLRHGHDQDHSHLFTRATSPLLFNHGETSPHSPSGSLRSSANMHLLQLHHSATLAGVSPIGFMNFNHADGNAPVSNLTTINMKDADLESRSSGASSDVDSESDVSFDDSASDRSDGSDSGPAHYEPLSAARAMALNRLQQHQRMQNRVLSSLHHNAVGNNQGEASRGPDVEYPSGDSIDSMRAEDSGESDSSGGLD
jgi:hypothetical protein